jgi:agmatinase
MAQELGLGSVRHMANFELHVSPSTIFSGYQKPFENADYVVVGVPFDLTSTFRTGARFAPLAIREASLNIETYSFRSSVYMEDVKIHDLGDLHVSSDIETTLKRLEASVKEMLEAKKTPVIVGGEHTVTLGTMRGVGGGDTAVIDFDAHLDLRNEYMGLTTSHTTFMRRVNERVKPRKIVEVGTRAVCKEELGYAKEAGILFFTTQQVRKLGVEATVRAVKEAVKTCGRIYLTVDMDVLDPAFAPAVQNPEPDGLSIQTLLDLISRICDRRIVALDLVEVAPPYDMGITAIQAAKIIFEALCGIEKARRG